MTRRIAILLLGAMALALPAGAETCSSGDLDWSTGTPLVTRTSDSATVNTEVVGTFLQVQLDQGKDIEGSWDLPTGVTSFELSGNEIGFRVCDDLVPVFRFAPLESPDLATEISAVSVATPRAIEYPISWYTGRL